jgi:hypothetical protein
MTGRKEEIAASTSGNRLLAKRGSAIGVYRTGRLGLGIICVAIVLLELAPPPARAALVVENDSVYGASSVVLDTSTGLYWVKPIETLGLTYSTVQTDIAAGLTGNFALASYSQVHTLLSDAGITDFTNGVAAGSYAGASAIVSAFGPTSGGTFSNGSYQGSYAQVVGVYAGNFDAYTIAYQLNATGEFGCTGVDCAETSIGNFSGSTAGPYGSWLVASSLDSGNTPSPVPLPASVWLMLGAIGGLSLLSRRRGGCGTQG